MKTLDKNWFSEGWIDFEYKQYILLDYLKQSERFYQENNIYPFLTDLLDHYNALVEYRNNLKSMEESFPKKIIGIDLKSKSFIYRRKTKQDFPFSETIQEIVDFSITEMQKVINRGKDLHKKLEESMTFQPVGSTPGNKDEGYLLVRHQKKVYAYRYRFSMIDSKNLLSTFLVRSFTSTLTNTPYKIKERLKGRYQDILNPAVFYVDIDSKALLEETLMPIIKKRFAKDFRGL